MRNDETIVETQFGKILGRKELSLQVYRGVPYARPPVGELRWQPPQKFEGWSGTYDAREYKSAPAQPDNLKPKHVLFGGFKIKEQSEDCLYLNIWAPEPDGKARPVMVFIHGGGFFIGSGSIELSQLHEVAANGIVCVSINYRLGALGFLFLDQLFDGFRNSGNCGMLDQVMALEWVKENIASFGGDPKQVTICGESAGGMSVGTLLAMPKAKGLFHQAIPQSGASHHALTAETATRIARRFLKICKVKPGDRDALYRLSTKKILRASIWTYALFTKKQRRSLLQSDYMKEMLFMPVIDGDSLPEWPIDAVRKGSASGVGLLVGSNKDEYRLYTHLINQTLAHDVEEWFKGSTPQAEVTDIYAGLSGPSEPTGLFRWLKSKGPQKKDYLSDIHGDLMFGVPCVRLADAQSAHASVYRYLLCYESAGAGKACHALDLPLMLKRLDIKVLVGQEALPMAITMNQAWSEFIKTGVPHHASLPAWPRYDPQLRPTMCLDYPQSTVINNPNGKRIDLWKNW